LLQLKKFKLVIVYVDDMLSNVYMIDNTAVIYRMIKIRGQTWRGRALHTKDEKNSYQHIPVYCY